MTLAEQSDYLVLRDSLKDGDVVFFSKPLTIWGKLTSFVTRSPYYHVGFFFWMQVPGPRAMLIESAQGGRRIVSLSSYVNKGHGLHVFRVPGLDWKAFEEGAMDKSGAVSYGNIDFIGIGLRELFSLKLPDNPSGEVCSEFVAKGLRSILPELPTLISPGKLANYLKMLPNVEEVT